MACERGVPTSDKALRKVTSEQRPALGGQDEERSREHVQRP